MSRQRTFPFRSSHHSCGGLPHAKKRGVGVLHTYTHWEPRGEMDPIQRALDVGQSRRYRSIFWEYTKADAFNRAIELAVGMSHQIDIDVAAFVDRLELGFAVVRNDPPIAGVDQGKHGAAGVRV